MEPTPQEEPEKKLTRRGFLESAGALTALGAVGLELESQLGGLLKEQSNIASRFSLPRIPSAKPPGPTPALRVVPDNSFSIFWITDTQFLSETNPQLYQRETNWVVNNWEAYNGKLVIHTGDMVQDGDVKSEWQAADEAMSIFLERGIPYTWCAGNHDDYENGDPTSGCMGYQWTSSFNPSIASQMVNKTQYAKWVSDYHDGMNTALEFTANGTNYLVINVEWIAESDTLAWMTGILDDPAYAYHRVILAPHAYIDYNGDDNDAKWGSIMSDFINGFVPIIDEYSDNIFLTLNGHFASECGYNTTSPINNRSELMYDRQDCADASGDPNGRGVDLADTSEIPDIDRVGGATLMILTFETSNNRIVARTYDTYAAKWRTDPYELYSVPLFSNALPASSSTTTTSTSTTPS